MPLLQSSAALPQKELDESGHLRMILQFVLLDGQIHPPSTLEHLLRFAFSCYMWSKDISRERTSLQALILHLICLNICYTVGEFTSGGHSNTSRLSGLMLSISVCKQRSKPKYRI